MSDRIFLTARWLDLLMLNYECDPEVLRPLVPRGTTLDSHEGKSYVSLVGFRFLDTRLLGVPIPFHRDFEEFNLRFYVRREHAGEVRRAVVFIRELVPRRAVAWLARLAYNEPYIALPMRSAITASPGRRAEYAWHRDGRWHTCGARAEGAFRLPDRGSLEEFITEHYWGYTRQRDGSTIEYRVEHPQWRVAAATGIEVDADLEGLYGPELARYLERPTSAFLAEGSPVRVHRPVRLAEMTDSR